MWLICQIGKGKSTRDLSFLAIKGLLAHRGAGGLAVERMAVRAPHRTLGNRMVIFLPELRAHTGVTLGAERPAAPAPRGRAARRGGSGPVSRLIRVTGPAAHLVPVHRHLPLGMAPPRRRA